MVRFFIYIIFYKILLYWHIIIYNILISFYQFVYSMAKNPTISIQSLWGIPQEESSTNIMWSCHIIDMQSTVKHTKHNIRVILDIWSFWDNKNNNFLTQAQLEWLGNLSEIDALIISHVHLDHIGNLLSLVKAWYEWDIIMSHTSKQLLLPILKDVIAILKQEYETINNRNKELWKKLKQALSIVKTKEVEKSQKKNAKEREIKKYSDEQIENAIVLLKKYNLTEESNSSEIGEIINPLPDIEFTDKDLMKTLSLIKAIDWETEENIVDKDGIKLSAKLYKAGHVEWASQTVLSFKHDPYNRSQEYKVLYTGDLGRVKEPILTDIPTAVKEKVNLTLTESTYGNRIHAERSPELKRICEELSSATSAVVIPTFSLWRSCEILSQIIKFIENGDLELNEGEKIYIDGKLAKDLMEILLTRYSEKYKFLTHPSIHMIESDDERAKLKKIPWRKIIIGSGGMFQWGTAPSHANKFMEDDKAKFMTVWYQGEWTRGRYLQENKWMVYTFNRHKQMKNRIYHPIHTIEKIKNRKEENISSLQISGQWTKDLEKILIDLYNNRDILNLEENEFIYVPSEFWDEWTSRKEIKDHKGKSYNPPRYWDTKRIKRAASLLYENHRDVYEYFYNKLKTIDEDEAYDLEDNFIANDLAWIVIYNDKIGKKHLKAQMIHFSTFSGHADRDEMLSLMEKTKTHQNHTTLLVHGDANARKELEQYIEKNKHITTKVIRPQLYETLQIDCKTYKRKIIKPE